jgi:EAL domain-containing protein (putative c-di-GMP-specific phosphodiesterase class I)
MSLSERFAAPARSVLVVDDDPFFLSLMGDMLDRLGFVEVVTATSAHAAALALSRRDQGFSVALCDLRMPHTDGIELIRMLADMAFSGAVVPISGDSRQMLELAAGLARSRGLLVPGVLQKPITRKAAAALLADGNLQAHNARPRQLLASPQDLHQAIAARAIGPVYQPRICTLTGEVLALEALARWQHPRHGAMLPAEFIPVAEASGQLSALSELMLDQMLEHAARWEEHGFRPGLTLNAPMASLLDPEFADALIYCIESHDFAWSRLTVEVSGSCPAYEVLPGLDNAIRDALPSTETLIRLRLNNLRIALSDLGNCHVSLAQLREWPFDEVTVHRDFAINPEADARALAVLESGSLLARRLGLRIVATGVETLDDWQSVMFSNGYDVAQGHFIAAPMPARDIMGWLGQWQQRLPALIPPQPLLRSS